MSRELTVLISETHSLALPHEFCAKRMKDECEDGTKAWNYVPRMASEWDAKRPIKLLSMLCHVGVLFLIIVPFRI